MTSNVPRGASLWPLVHWRERHVDGTNEFLTEFFPRGVDVTGTGRLAVNPRRVVHETIDGETILIHLETGAYYSLEGSGAELWNLLVSGHSVDELCAEVARRYPATGDAASAARTFATEVLREQLLEPAADADAPRPAPPEAVPGQPFQAPALNKYTDMEYFLLLDPIHEVEEAGWPHERPSEPDAAERVAGS
jgi:hypothetical protein